jgi:rubrerythrin
MPIETVADLREHLQTAIRVELSTIPPYLYAMYSIADSTSEWAQLIRSIAAEEMLHATLAANVLLAIGGEPRFYDADVMPRYPSPLLHHEPELMVDLEPFSAELLERLFLRIEQPATPGAHVSPDNWESQGQLYRELEHALRRLDAEDGVFHEPQIERQLHDPHNYSAVRYDSDASGGLVKVDCLDRAMDALEVMIHQGEGLSDERYADEDHAELTHYWKFRRVLENASDVGAIHPAVRNPTLDQLPEHVRPLARFSNATYSYLFVVMDRLFAAETPNRQELVGVLYGGMVGLVGPVARYLMTVPVSESEMAGPPFQRFEFADPDGAEDELREMAGALVDVHPDLAPVLRSV